MSQERPASTRPVLLLGPAQATRRFAGALLLLGYRGLPAIDAGAALRVLATCETAMQTGIVCAELVDLLATIREIHESIALPLVWTLCGARPAADAATALQGQSVRFLLSEPFNQEDLRFVLNEAYNFGGHPVLRTEPRVPTSLRARIVTKTGERVAVVCNLSMEGAFLATPRPTLRGGRVDVELPLPALTVRSAADVLWNNVPGNLRRSNSPVGMGVRFVDLPAASIAALRAYLEERAASYQL